MSLTCINYVKRNPRSGRVDLRAPIHAWFFPLIGGREIPETHDVCGGKISFELVHSTDYDDDGNFCCNGTEIVAYCRDCNQSVVEVCGLDAGSVFNELANNDAESNERWLAEQRRIYAQTRQDHFAHHVKRLLDFPLHVFAHCPEIRAMSDSDKEWYRNLSTRSVL